MKIYDCFTFFNELDLLEIRLQELWESVDYFIISESDHSFTGKSKNFVLLDNWKRFQQYSEKIRHITVTDMPNNGNPWNNERWQRNSLARGLTDISDLDLIIVSDCDEIPRAEAVDMIRQDTNMYDRYILGHPMSQYKFNFVKVYPELVQHNIIMTRAKQFTKPQQEREYTFHWKCVPPENTVKIEHGGWHFSYFGDDIDAVTKIQNFSHTETPQSVMDNHNIDYMIKHGCGHHGLKHAERFSIVAMDNYFPKCITDNLDRWQHRIASNPITSLNELYE